MQRASAQLCGPGSTNLTSLCVAVSPSVDTVCERQHFPHSQLLTAGCRTHGICKPAMDSRALGAFWPPKVASSAAPLHQCSPVWPQTQGHTGLAHKVAFKTASGSKSCSPGCFGNAIGRAVGDARRRPLGGRVGKHVCHGWGCPRPRQNLSRISL